ncbi:DNA helicase-2 / ATP-dependent DNA helicase PcrA [Clostridium amylolyticum]|uniref:DNA 3'-5' helicase n=1 Tax=Clostridium amylolyticum TaxID=1121298 RepID=A0A1M6IAA1_9CLOT|nr:UvrD-helicase domain-containing protein [Clostridium amylolyticum]SHJ31401.1 DNA helicase-2 / ATP-dependent DNA helicase PcrA [Clostridium amylolyticum]
MELRKELIIAAAGSGKTTELVRNVLHAIESVNSTRVIAVITYTNSATEELIKRLEEVVSIPSNVFIGTIHSFLLSYLIKPFAKSKGLIEDDIIVNDINLNLNAKGKDYYIMKNRVLSSLSKKGILTYDQIATVSNKLLSDPIVKERFCNRISYVLVDEFQDATKQQFDILETLRKGKKTNVILVGDPEQKIMSFASKEKKRNRKGDLKQHPIISLQEKKSYKVVKLENNYRSSKTIVNFLNNFHCNIKQVYRCEKITSMNEVTFIDLSDIDEIVEKFNLLCLEKKFLASSPKTKFFLSYQNNKFKGSVSNIRKNEDYSKCLCITMDLIKSLYNKSKSEIMDEFNITIIEFRKKCIELIDYFRKNINNIEYWGKEVEVKFGDFNNYQKSIKECSIDNNEIINKYYNVVSGIFISTKENIDKCREYCLTIHKAKGLEADAVLVLARNEDELRKWLECDRNKRIDEVSDSCHLGYVAFSRAKEFLCIACENAIGEDTKQILNNLGVIVCT